MKSSLISICCGAIALYASAAHAQTIAEINGNKFVSPYRNRDVSNVTGLITAKGPDGFWIRSTRPDQSPKTSESLYVYDNGTVSANLTAGDIITLGGRITEYRSSPTYLFLTELTRPSNVRKLSSNNEVAALVIGEDTLAPPTDLYTSLDNGDVFGVPNNVSQISVKNPELEPEKYGLDFWESLVGELVTVQNPSAVGKPNQFGDTYVVGNWKTTGQNARGGLTLISGASTNPEGIVIGDPLDGTNNPGNTKIGDTLEDVTGIVTQAFGTYRILPLTALSIISSREPALPEPVDYVGGSCWSLTVGDYNIENLSPSSDGIADRARHIVQYLNSPNIIFLQEIQDDTGPTDDGTVSSNRTLEVLVDAISAIGSVHYSFIDIVPVNDQDGGQPGGNIRVAYLYNSDVLELVDPNPGSSTDATTVVEGPALSFNPGRIEPNSSAWNASRKPLAAHWRVKADGATFFTINVHFTSKGGSSPIGGDPRPPVNLGVDQRAQQANITAAFIADILAEDPDAAIILAGDFNEFTFVEPLKLLVSESGLVDLDEAAGIDPVERYTYVFDGSNQELDHIFVSRKIAEGRPKLEHVHVNTWVSFDDQTSDHDPSVAQLCVC